MSEPRHVAAPRFCTVHRAAVFFQHPLLVPFLLFEPQRGGERVRQPCRVLLLQRAPSRNEARLGGGLKACKTQAGTAFIGCGGDLLTRLSS